MTTQTAIFILLYLVGIVVAFRAGQLKAYQDIDKAETEALQEIRKATEALQKEIERLMESKTKEEYD